MPSPKPPDQAGIRAVVAQLNRVMHRAHARLQAIREACPHPNVTRTPRSNTGNYDPSCDRYWYDCKCPDCEKFWTEDQ